MKIDRANVEACAQAMMDEENARLEANGIDKDLAEHYEMVRELLRPKGDGGESLLAEFTKLLEKKNAAWRPREAFEYGLQAKGREYSDALMDYIRSVILAPEMQAADDRLQSLFNEMQQILGKEHSCMITHYLEYHRTCYGTIPYYIDKFFNAGYCCHDDETAPGGAPKPE